MIALQILEIRDFMNKFLLSDIFDHFLLQEAMIASDAVWSLDGKLQDGFYSQEELIEQGLAGFAFLPFGNMRARCFDLIKGRRTPACFKFVLLLSPENLNRTLTKLHSSFSASDISGMFLNLKFQNRQLIVTSGVSYRIFSMDKSLEHEWDNLVRQFFKKHQITFLEV